MPTAQKFAIVGAGPAGLYLAYRLKRRMPDADVRVLEQNSADATFGFGVVFSDQALAFLEADDSETAAAIAPHMQTWSDMQLNHRGEVITLDGVGFSAIGRLELLQLLQQRANSVGVSLNFNQTIDSLAELDWADVVVGADGLNSIVRRAHEGDFGTSLSYFGNKFAWFGTSQVFDTLTQTFVETEWGAFNAHHYRYANDRSTFIVECDRETWHHAGFSSLDPAESKQRCEEVFAGVLNRHALISNKSDWRSFPRLWNERWSFGNRVLLGDALHTAHFSIGSGTRLAFEDAIALDTALEQSPGDLALAFGTYQTNREPILRKLVGAANTSALWYEDFGERMQLDPIDFGYNYITRSGRVTMERLKKIAPSFAANYLSARPEPIIDPVADDSAGAIEIGFDRLCHQNASQILFDNLANGRADRPAAHGPFGTITYREICALAARYGNAFKAFELKRGERIVFLADDTPSTAAAFFGAMRAGYVPVVLNTLTPPDLLQFYLQDSAARIALADAAFIATFNETAVANTQLEQVVVIGQADFATVKVVAESNFLEDAPPNLTAAPTRPDDMAFWLYSSGTTGRPKGIVHLHHDMAYTAESYAKRILKLTPDDICYSVPKIFFAYGLGNTLTFPFAAGASCVLMSGQPRPDVVLSAIEKHKPTVFFGLPTLYTALAREEQAVGTDFSSIRLSISAAETLSKSVFDQWRDLTGQEVVEGLGSTELLHIYLSNRPDLKKLGAAGIRVPGYEVELRDGDGNALGDNKEGVLWARAHSSAPLYWNRPDKTAETMQGDWINTGDRFSRDTDGFYFFKGRADDLIKVSGQWVHPLEVERCLQTHSDVGECAVFAHKMDDERMTLRAFVSLKTGLPSNPQTTTKDLQDFVKGALLPYKYPRIVEYLKDLPKTGTGKLDRHALKDRPVAAPATDA